MAAAIGGSVSMETMGPDVTAALRGLCTALVTSYADEIAEGYAEAQGPASFKLTQRLTELSDTCQVRCIFLFDR